MDAQNQVGQIMFITQHIRFPLFSALSNIVYFEWRLQPYLVSILVTAYLEYSKQSLLCTKHNVSNLILRYPF